MTSKYDLPPGSYVNKGEYVFPLQEKNLNNKIVNNGIPLINDIQYDELLILRVKFFEGLAPSPYSGNIALTKEGKLLAWRQNCVQGDSWSVYNEHWQLSANLTQSLVALDVVPRHAAIEVDLSEPDETIESESDDIFTFWVADLREDAQFFQCTVEEFLDRYVIDTAIHWEGLWLVKPGDVLNV